MTPGPVETIPELGPGRTLRPEIRGRRGVVAAGKSFAVAAGMRVFARGGNAVDAGLAAVLAAAVTELSHFGFGGECPLLIHDARRGQSYVVPGLGPAPRLATPAVFAEQGWIDTNGPRACTVPAVLDAVCLALARSGTLSLSEILEPALELARGFPMYETLHHHLLAERDACARWPSTLAAYYPEGEVTPIGALFRQPDLAATLAALAAAEAAARRRAGREEAIGAARDAFYLGDIGRSLAAAAEAAGGLLRHDDLVGWRGTVEAPARGRYRGLEVLKGGFWCQGPALLAALGILEGFDLRAMGHLSADAIHAMVESLKLALDDRDAHFGDPEHAPVAADTLLSSAYAEARRALIDPGSASLVHRPGLGGAMPRVAGASPSAAGDTTAISSADAEGNLLSAVPSSGWLLGGAFVAAGTGVPLGNRMQSFVLDARRPNCLAPGKRPRMTLTPSLLLRDGKPFLAIGTPGGDSQDQQILQVLSALLDHGLTLQRAIEAPRFNSEHCQSSFGRHADAPGVLSVETSLPAGVRQALASRGHLLRELPPFGMGTGVTAAGLEPSGTLRAGADPRGERYALGD